MESMVKNNLEEENKKSSKEEMKKKEDLKEAKNKELEKKEKPEKKKEGTRFKKVEANEKKIKKEFQNMESSTKRKKWVVPVVLISILLIVGIVVSTIFALVNMGNEKIISGTSISGIDVSGLSKEEALTRMQTIYEEKKEKEIDIKYEDYETSLNPTLMEVNYDVEKAVDEAYNIGKSGNIFTNNYAILFTLIGKKNIDVNMTLNEEITKQTIEDIGVNLPGIVIESSYSIEDDELIITKGEEGIYIDTENLLTKVKENLNDINASKDYIEIPVINKMPETIDIEKIHEEVYKEAQDAYYTKEPFAVYPEVEGIDFDVEEAKKILEEDKEEYVIKLTITKPEITLDKIGSEAFPEQLSTFTTRYDVSDTNRTTNLVIACQKISGKVILPGETFSYNQALGPRTAAAGYKNGKIYSGGQVVDGIGGGICQISSTLYNTVLKANLEIVERRNHQFVTSYLPAGRDATVVYGMTDFKFKNTRQYPIRIEASAKNGIATVSIYGIKEENEYTFDFNTKTVATIPYTTKYEEDASLPVGTEIVKQKGVNGLKTETYITKMLNGKVVSTTLLSKDTYDAMTKIVVKGTKATTTTNTESTDNQADTQSKEQNKEENTEQNKEQSSDKTAPTSNGNLSTDNKTTIDNTKENSETNSTGADSKQDGEKTE